MNKISSLFYAVVISVSFMSCNNNGARDYSGEKEKMNSSFTASVVDVPDNVFSISSAVVSDNKIYYDYVNNRISTGIYISESADSEIYEMIPDFEYDYISDCAVSDSYLYLVYNINNTDYIAKVDKSGNIVCKNECETIFSVYLSENNVYLISFNSSEQLIVSVYDSNLAEVSEINISEKLCSQDEKAAELKIDENGTGFLEIAYDIQYSGKEVNDYKTKIIEFNLLSLSVINTYEVSNGTDFLVSEESVSVISYENNSIYVDSYSRTDGEYSGYNEMSAVEKLYKDCFVSENSVKNSDDYSVIFKPNEADEIIHHINSYKDKKVIITMTDKQSVNILCTDISGTIENEYSFEILSDYIISDELSVSDGIIAVMAYNSANNKTAVFTYSIESGEMWVSEYEEEISQVEVFDKDTLILLPKDENDPFLLWDYFKENKFEYENIDLKCNQIMIFRNNRNGVSMIGINGNNFSLFNIDNEKKIIRDANLELSGDSNSIKVSNGCNDSGFYIITDEKVYEYSADNLNAVADIADFNNLCDVNFIIPIDKDEFIIYGLDHASYKFTLINMKRNLSKNRVMLKVAVENGLESAVYDRIQYFNKYSTDAYAVRTEINEDVNDIADIYIYNSIYDVPDVLGEESCYNFNDFAESQSSKYLPAAFPGSNADGEIYKIVPSFSFMKYGEDSVDLDSGMNTEESCIKKLIIYQLSDYIDFNNKLCDFHNEDFYSKISDIKGSKLTSKFTEINDMSELINDDYIPYKTVIVPDMYITAVKSDRISHAIDFAESFLSEEYQDLALSERFNFLPVKKTTYEKLFLKNDTRKEDKDIILKMLDGSEVYYGYNKSFTDIIYNNILEFSGDADEYSKLADKIEDNVNLYLKERK